MLLDWLMLYVVTFLLTCCLFTHYHQNRKLLQEEEEEEGEEGQGEHRIHRNAASLLCFAKYLWAVTLKALQCIDQLLIRCLALIFADHLNEDQFIDSLEAGLNETCSKGSANEESAKVEIVELSTTIYELYIDFWYRNVKLEEEHSTEDNDNFQYHCKKGIEVALTNFYKLCSEQINTKKLALELVRQTEAHLLDRNVANVQLRTKDEVALLLALIDGVFVRVLPADVNPLVTNCNCPGRKNCLPNCSNPVRLFIYNLIVYSLFLPLIDRITHPLYFFYNFIYIASQLGGLSLSEYLDQFDSNGLYEEGPSESQPVPITFELEEGEGEKALFYEAIEESPKELSVFSNIKIPMVKISGGEMASSIAKISPYIDYIIFFSALECDREVKNGRRGDKQQQQHLQSLNGQSFLRRSYQVKRRFREFLSFQQKLEKNPDYRLIMAQINSKPSNIQFHSSAFFNYIKSTKINENSPLVKLRRDCLENFLIQLSKNKDINESRELCEFLGYKYKSMLDVRQQLKAATSMNTDATKNTTSNEKSHSTRSFELNFKNLKDIFRIFLPDHAKLGQVATHIDDVVVNDQVFNKFSITKIETTSDEQNHMILKLKLDKWAAMSGGEESDSKVRPVGASADPNADRQMDHSLISCLLVLVFRKVFVFQRYFANRAAHLLHSILTRLRNIFTFSRMFRFYLHYLHSYLGSMENDSVDAFLSSYERFYALLREKDLKELFQLYVRLSQEKTLRRLENPESSWNLRLRLCRVAFSLCGHLGLGDNMTASFDTQHANKLLIYRLLNVFTNEINR